MLTKNCLSCGEEKSVECFRSDGYLNSGKKAYKARCKDCAKAIRLKRLPLLAQIPQGEALEELEQPGVTFRDTLPACSRYVVTYAQNATPAHTGFLEALQVYCAARQAHLVVIPGRYKNPTSLFTRADETNDWHDAALIPHLFNGRMQVGPDLTIFGDMPIQPTARKPLSSLEIFTSNQSAVFGHPRLQFKTVASSIESLPKILTTTGAVTVPNYTVSKTGVVSDEHHVIGACLIETDGSEFHLRQLLADEHGTFTDLDKVYSCDGVTDAPRARALYCGDIHVAFRDDIITDATFLNTDSICALLQPEEIIVSDTLHFDARNHHHIGDAQDGFDRYHGAKRNSVRDEVIEAIQYLDEVSPANARTIVLASNHDEHLDRWIWSLEEANPDSDYENAAFFYETKAALYNERIINERWVPAFELWYGLLGKHTESTYFVRRTEDYFVDGILCLHGDRGPSGNRGSAEAFAKLSPRTIVGHCHAPSILDGCTTVGVTGSLKQNYNESSPSAWLNSHAVVYASGHRCLITVLPSTGNWRIVA